MHLGSAVGTQREADAKAKATIFCPSYYDMGPRLVEQLAGRFGEQLMVTRIATDEAELTDCPDDLVICISPIQSVLQVPTLQIAPVPSSTDIANLRSKIEGILDARKRSAFKDLLHELIDPVLFEVRDDLSDRAVCIEHMGRGLVDSGFADRPYINKVFEREEMSSTAMGAFAMPHTVGLVGKHSRISVLISKSPSNGRIRRSTSFSCCALARRSARRSTRYSTAWRALSSNPPTYADFWNARHTKPSSTRSPAWPIRLTATFPLGGYLLRIDGAVLERTLGHGAPRILGARNRVARAGSGKRDRSNRTRQRSQYQPKAPSQMSYVVIGNADSDASLIGIPK